MPLPGIVTRVAVLKDPHVDRTKRHRLIDVLAIAFCGAEGWEEMEELGIAREDWLGEKLGPARIPAWGALANACSPPVLTPRQERPARRQTCIRRALPIPAQAAATEGASR